MIDYCLTAASCIPFLMYIFLLIKEEVLKPERSIKEILRFDNLILIIVFIIFTTYKVSMVNQMLFFTINLYFYVNKLYDKKLKQKINIKENIIPIILIYVLAVLSFIPYIFFEQLRYSYYIAFGLIFFFHYFYLIVNTTKKY